MRMVLNPAAFTESISNCIGTSLPHALGPPMASMVLPRFQPTPISAAMDLAVGSAWVMAASPDADADAGAAA